VTFGQTARRALEGIAASRGFAVTIEEIDLVEFARDDLRVRVIRDPVSWEIDLRVWRASHAAEQAAPYSWGEIQESLGVQDASPPQLRNDVEVAFAREFMAPLFLTVADSDEGELFQRLDDARKLRGIRYAAAEHLGQARSKAAVAWRQGAWNDVVLALQSIEPYLTPSEVRKLVFARRHRHLPGRPGQ
jgi:hypothetical protein